MTYPETDSYGSVQGVVALVGVFTENGDFGPFTNPTKDTVIEWLDQVSDVFNVALANAGFTVPVDQSDAFNAISLKVNAIVADLCNLANNTGRFFTERAREFGVNPNKIIQSEINNWVSENAVGLTNMGVPRVKSTLGAIGSRGCNSKGDRIAPIFQRDGFGNRFENWSDD